MIATVPQSVLGIDSDIKLLCGFAMCMGLQTYLNWPTQANLGQPCGKIEALDGTSHKLWR